MIWERDKAAIAASKFHAHLDECQQCEVHPFDLCSIGRKLLAGFVAPVGVPAVRPRLVQGEPASELAIGFVEPLKPEPRR